MRKGDDITCNKEEKTFSFNTLKPRQNGSGDKPLLQQKVTQLNDAIPRH